MKTIFSGYTDETLVQLTLTGNTDAYCELVTRYKNAIFNYILGFTSDYHSVEDITQDTFVDGFMQLSTLKEHPKVASWLFGIAKRKSLNHVSKRKKFEDISEYEEILFSNDASPETFLIEKEKKAIVHSAVESLSDCCKEVAKLFYIDEKSISYIAFRLNIPVGTVKSRLYEARSKLKGALSIMEENKTYELPDNLEKTIKEKIKELQKYYSVNENNKNDYHSQLEQTVSLINKMPESKQKYNDFASVYLHAYYKEGENAELKSKLIENAEKGENADALCSLMVDDVLSLGENYSEWIKKIDNECIIKLESLNSKNNIGIMFFWRGRAELGVKNIDKAYENFCKAVELINKDEVYHANAVAAMRSVEYMRENSENMYDGFYAMGESFAFSDRKMIFVSEPGCSTPAVMYEKHKLKALFYYISRCDEVIFDLTMRTGEKITSLDGKSSLTLVAFEQKVSVYAGQFEKCMQLRYSCPGEYEADIWFADGIGLVKVVFSGNRGNESYELSEYDIKGGKGYLPFCEGNRWRYIKPDLPDYLYQCFEREIIYTDGEIANFSVVQLVTMKKNFITECDLDSDIYIELCEKKCREWKIDEAIGMLSEAVRKNSTEHATLTALAGIDYLNRFKQYANKGYRFCPSSMNASYFREKDGKVTYDESGVYSFGPYRWGTRHEENRIFGVKPIRYLQQLFYCVYDSKWVPGYSEEHYFEREMVKVRLAVTDGGTVTVKAGIFENCIKVTVSLENPELGIDYYFNDYSHVHHGTKEFWFAPGVGIIKFDYTWGTSLKSQSELVTFTAPAAKDEYMPLHIGAGWEYDEINLTNEGYRAKRIIKVVSGMNGKFLATDAQEFLYLGTEQEYEDFKKKLI